MTLNVAAIIATLGGAAEIHRRAQAAGFQITYPAIRKIASRNSITADNLALLVRLGQEIGRPILVEDYIETERKIA